MKEINTALIGKVLYPVNKGGIQMIKNQRTKNLETKDCGELFHIGQVNMQKSHSL